MMIDDDYCGSDDDDNNVDDDLTNMFCIITQPVYVFCLAVAISILVRLLVQFRTNNGQLDPMLNSFCITQFEKIYFFRDMINQFVNSCYAVLFRFVSFVLCESLNETVTNTRFSYSFLLFKFELFYASFYLTNLR